MIHTNNTIALAVISFAITALVSTSYVHAQIQTPNPPPPQLPPGSVVIPPSQQHGPPLAQIQSDIAKHQQQGIQYAQAMTNLINQRLGNDTSAAHLAQVLKTLTAQGKIDCPTPISNPGHCFLTPKPTGIAPPIG